MCSWSTSWTGSSMYRYRHYLHSKSIAKTCDTDCTIQECTACSGPSLASNAPLVCHQGSWSFSRPSCYVQLGSTFYVFHMCFVSCDTPGTPLICLAAFSFLLLWQQPVYFALDSHVCKRTNLVWFPFVSIIDKHNSQLICQNVEWRCHCPVCQSWSSAFLFPYRM